MKNYLRLILVSGMFFSILPEICCGQYAPAAGQAGSDAISKTDSRIKDWASGCTVVRGYIQRSDTSVTYSQNGVTSNRAFYGSATDATGAAAGGMHVVSLGDGGSAVLTFPKAIRDGEGADFAVFENALPMTIPPYQYFIELAFVEVSSDGKRFVRFPSVSLTPTDNQVGTFGQIDPTLIHNLAGKYTADYGTPFDLHELADSVAVDIRHITHVRVVDVVGSIDPRYGSYDAQGHLINDPYPTPFWNGGFDLQAIAVLNEEGTTGLETAAAKTTSLYPNPLRSREILHVVPGDSFSGQLQARIFDTAGNLWVDTPVTSNEISGLDVLPAGTYIFCLRNHTTEYRARLVILK